MDIREQKAEQPVIAAFYARVSTSKQEREETIESQVKEIEDRAKQDEVEIGYDLKFKDEGWSGEMLARPQLDLLRDAIKEKKFQQLYVYDLGRLSRSFMDQLILLSEFKDHNIKVVSLHDINAETDEQVFARNVMGLFHDYERKKIAERMRRGKLYKARAGILINGGALYGFNYIKKTDKENARYEINEDEKKVVLQVQDWFGNEEISINEIIRRLYKLGISPRKKKSEFWEKGPLTRLLNCDTYFTGKAYYNKYEAVVAKRPLKQELYKKIKKSSRKLRSRDEWIAIDVPIINKDSTLYQKILNRLAYNKKYARKNRKFDYLLSEKISCGCGMKRAGDGSNKFGHFYYRCEERLHTFPKTERKCKIKGINAQILDSMVWNKLKDHLLNPSILRSHAEEWLRIQAMKSYDTAEKSRLEEQLGNVAKEEIRYAKAYGEGDIDHKVYKELIREVKKRKLSYKRQLQQLEETVSVEKIDIDIDDLCVEVQKVLDAMEYPSEFVNKKQLVRDIIDNVIIKERSEVEVWAHIPLTSLNTLKLGHEPICRDCRPSECGEVHFV